MPATLHFPMPSSSALEGPDLLSSTKQLVKKPLLMNVCECGLWTDRVPGGRGQHAHMGYFREFSKGTICKEVGREQGNHRAGTVP